MRILFTALFLSVLLGSCDALVTYQFRLQNGTAEDISLTYSRNSKDTTVTLAPGAQAFVLEQQEINSGVKPYFKEEDSIWWIKTLRARQLDGSPTKFNLKEAKRWDFVAEDGLGKYSLKLSDSDF